MIIYNLELKFLEQQKKNRGDLCSEDNITQEKWISYSLRIHKLAILLCLKHNYDNI